MARIADPHRRNDILAAARIEFEERGYVQTRMADVAHRAGVAPGTIYLYFASKEAIVLALAEQFYTGLAEATQAALDHPNIVEAIRLTVKTAFQFIAQERDLLKLMHLDLGLKPLFQPLPARRGFYDGLATQLQNWQGRGALAGYDPPILADLLTGMVERAAASCFLYGEGDLDRYEATIIALLQHTLLDPGAMLAVGN